MARVNITKTLISDINNVVNNMKLKEYEATVEPLFYRAPDARSNNPKHIVDFERELWGEAYHLIDKVPNSWYKRPRGSCSIVYQVRSEKHDSRVFDVVRHDVSNLVRIPPTCDLFSPEVRVFIEGEEAKDWVAKVDVFEDARVALEAKYLAIADNLRNLLNFCVSLNAAIKIYPDLVLYLSEQYIRAVNRVDVRNARGARAAVPEINTALLTSTAVMHKLGGA